MRIYFLVVKINPGIPAFLDQIFSNSEYQFVGVGCVPVVRNRSMLRWIRRQVAFWGVTGSLVQACRMIAHRFSTQRLSKIPTQSALDRVCSGHNVPLHSVRNPNGARFIEFINEREVDVLVSFQPWILGEQILAAPKVMCMNVHTGILPGYRGLRPIFRMMSDNLPELGITVHTMTQSIDAGRVLETVRWCNKPGSTLVENSRLAYNAAATGVLAALGRIERGEVENLPTIPENSPYFAEPTHSEVRAARKRGLRFR